MSAVVEFVIPIRTKNLLNVPVPNSRAAAIAIRRGHASQRKAATLTTFAALRRANVHPADLLPIRVTLTRLTSAAKAFDDDGLVSSQKYVRDGIAKALGVDDGSPLIKFRYRAHRCERGAFGTHVRIEKREEAKKT